MSEVSRPVDRLTISVLVDNTVEWFTALPPGFQAEVPQQLSNSPPIDTELTGVPFMDLENYCCGAHGLGLLVETVIDGETHTVLFDTGPETKSIVRNVHALKTDMGKVERIVLSHWHSDHSGGVLSALRLIKASNPTGTVTVDLHPDRPMARGVSRPPAYDTPLARLPADPTFAEVEAAGGVVELNSEGHAIAGASCWVSGEIPRLTEYENGIVGGIQWKEKDGVAGWAPDPYIMDERYMVVDVKNTGLVIFSSCSHAGIVNVVKDALMHFHRPIALVLGGFHLAGKEMEARIAPTVEFFARLEPRAERILPLHCTGFHAKVALANALGDALVPAGVGSKIVIGK